MMKSSKLNVRTFGLGFVDQAHLTLSTVLVMVAKTPLFSLAMLVPFWGELVVVVLMVRCLVI